MQYDKNTFIYFGLFLNETDKQMLINMLPPGITNIRYDKMFVDHMTLLFKSDVNSEKGMSIIDFINMTGRECDDNNLKHKTHPIYIDGIGISDKAVAFRVRKTPFLESICMNKHMHITIMTMNGGKPVDSNRITQWNDIPEIKVNPYFAVYTTRGIMS